MRHLYSILFYVLAPLLLVRLLWKSCRTPAYRMRISERFGLYHGQPVVAPGSIWIHAVSVGECEAAFPIINALLERGDIPLLITSTTPTGSARLQAVLGDAVQHVYLPYDLPGAVSRFIDYFRPRIGLIMETEIWPNLLQICSSRQIPLAIINGRLSEKSAQGYAKLRSFVGQSLNAVTHVAAQTRLDADRYINIGARPDKISVMGNIKFEVEFDNEAQELARTLRQELFPRRAVWIAGSTHPGEEEQILDALVEVKKSVPQLLLILAPRHPERSGDVRILCEKRGLLTQKRSDGLFCRSETSVFLIDGIGELRKFYGAADVAFVGGSLVPHGGQNILEAAVAGLPVVFGPYMMNFAEITRNLLDAGVGVQVDSPAMLAEWVLRFLQEPQLAIGYGRKGRAFVTSNRGALGRVLSIVDDLLSKESSKIKQVPQNL